MKEQIKKEMSNAIGSYSNSLTDSIAERCTEIALKYIEQSRQAAVSGTFCEKCNPNGIEDGNVIRCKKCGIGLALIEQNYH